MKRKLLLAKAILFLCFFYSIGLNAQIFERWADIVKWDGVTPWRNYMIYSPAYMGPNALPVPFMANGTIDSISNIGVHFAFHSCAGDKTKNLRITGNYCFLKNRISADVSWIPAEFFKVDPVTKEKRHVYKSGYNDTKAKGDIYANVNIQILNKWRKYIHLALRAGFRYPTSSSVDAARFTDAPGYHFDVSAAKPLLGDHLKIITMAGMYIWQLNTEGQNDAFLYGGGLEYNSNKWKLTTSCRGYSGYRNDGDHPVVINSSIEKRSKNISFTLNLQKGLRDYDFVSVETGIKYLFMQPGKE